MTRTILEGGIAEISVKKSRFISHILPVSNEEEAISFIEGIRKQHRDATHNVYAYRAGGTDRFSDDGEPSHSAGLPVLDMMIKENLDYICVVITRYFGGTKLGVGGLVRAYTGSFKEGLGELSVVELDRFAKVNFSYDYSLHGKVMSHIDKDDRIIIEDTLFSDHVEMSAYVPVEILHSTLEHFAEISNAKISSEVAGYKMIHAVNKKIIKEMEI